MRRAARLDENHRAVVNAFERCGCTVLSLAGVGFGAPDLAVGVSGQTLLVEVKPDVGEKRRRNPRENQVAFAASWRGGPVHVVRTVKEAWELARLVRMGWRNGVPPRVGVGVEC